MIEIVGGAIDFMPITRLHQARSSHDRRQTVTSLGYWRELLVQDLAIILKTVLFAASTFVHRSVPASHLSSTFY